MAASSLSAGEPVGFYEKHRYFHKEDAAIGNLVPELEKRGLAESVEGLSIAKSKLLENPHLRPILKPYFDQLDVRLCTTLGPDPHHRFVLSLEPGQRDRIIVHILSPGSQVELTQDSWRDPPGLGPLKGVPASNGLLEVPNAILKKRGCEHIPIQMDDGGIVIHDRRLAFRFIRGSTITYDLHNNSNAATRDVTPK